MKRITQEIGSTAAKRKKITTERNTDNIQQASISASIIDVVDTNERVSSNEISKSICKPIDIFALNGDCVREILKYCTFADLFNMCKASDELKLAVLENGVRGRMIDFKELGECCHILDVFKIFGQQMTKIKISENNIQYKDRNISKFDEILRLISTYCSTDTLKYLQLQYNCETSIKKRFLFQSLPFFRCIESFIIYERCHHYNSRAVYNPSVNDFIERILGNAVNINEILMRNVCITGRFFYSHHIRNLKILSLISCNVQLADPFIQFMQDKPKLKTFAWESSSLLGIMDTDASNSSIFVFDLVTSNIPDLETISYDNNETDEFYPECKQLLAKLNKLKILSYPIITIDCLKILAQKNTVEKFQGSISIDNSIDLNFLRNYSSLKSMYVFTSDNGDAKRFNIKLLSKLFYLTDCHLDFVQVDDDVVKVALEFARNLSTLYISAMMGTFPTALYSELIKIRLTHGLLKNPLIIYIKKKAVQKIIHRLGQSYKPDIITILANVNENKNCWNLY